MAAASEPVSPEEVFSVPYLDRWLLFSPRTRTSALVNGPAVQAIARSAVGDAEGVPESMRDLWRTLTLDPVACAEESEPSEKLVIIPTRACNMNCVYCDFAATCAPGRILSPRLACRLFDHFAESRRESGMDRVRVHFFGGEPTVAGECVETIVHYVRAACADMGVTPWFEVTTNGIFDPSAVPFLGDYIDSLVVSVDGPRALHDQTRRTPDGGGTYETIAANLGRLRTYPVELSLRTCISDRSVDAMADIAVHLTEEFGPEVVCFEMLAENSATKRAGLSAPDPLEFASGVLRAERELSTRGVRVVHGPSECAGPRRTSCPLGRGTLMMNPDGSLTACYLPPRRWSALGVDLSVGRVTPDSGVTLRPGGLEAVAGLLDEKPRCAKCFCRFSCAGGCHVDQTPPGCSEDYDHRCRAIRVMTAARLVRNLEGWEAASRLLGRPEALTTLAEFPDDRLSAQARVRR